MAIIGIGTDICQITRIEKLLAKNGDKFVNRILTPAEKKHEITFAYIAKRYAAKEACAKALGLGIGANLSFQDMEISNTENGKPLLNVKNKPGINFHISISDEKDYAIAMVVAEKE